MTVIPNKLGVPSAIAFAVLWIICSATVKLLPDFMMAMTGYMLHADFSSTGWTLTWSGFFLGLIAWALWAGISAWLIAVIYIQLLKAAVMKRLLGGQNA